MLTKKTTEPLEILPLTITESNQRVAKVDFTCDRCGELFATQLLLKKQVEAKKGTQIICSQCRSSVEEQRTKK
jgi:transcription elongation factor Elf1